MRRTDACLPVPGLAEGGFSLVELLVAMVFMGILMAGLSTVFKTSLTTYVTAAETTSSSRHNRLALETLFDDLNQAGMVASSLIQPPTYVTTANPPFKIIPNVPYASTDVPNVATAVNNGQKAWAVTDQLLLFYERILPYSTTMGSGLSGTGVGVANGVTLANSLAGTKATVINFPTKAQATAAATDVTAAIAAQMNVILVSSAVQLSVTGLTANGDNTCNVTLGAGTNGPQTSGNSVAIGSVVYLVVKDQYVCYSIKPMLLDPANPNTFTPCLVRDLISYTENGTVSNLPPWINTVSSTIVADNVTGFHVGLSANGGNTWAGTDGTGAWVAGNTAWTDITGGTSFSAPQLNYQLANFDTKAVPVPVVDDLFWFRAYPILVRIDIQTRTVNQRTEYGTTVAGTPALGYNYQTRTMVLNPRHFGLTY